MVFSLNNKNGLFFGFLFLASMSCSLLEGLPWDAQKQAASQVLNLSTPTVSPTIPLNATRTPVKAAKTPERSFCSVTADSLHLRASPGERAPVAGYLRAGDRLILTNHPRAGSWVEVITQAGLNGWVNSNFTDCERKKP